MSILKHLNSIFALLSLLIVLPNCGPNYKGLEGAASVDTDHDSSFLIASNEAFCPTMEGTQRAENGLRYGWQDVDGDGQPESCVVKVKNVKILFSDSIRDGLAQSYMDLCQSIANRSQGFIHCSRINQTERGGFYVRLLGDDERPLQGLHRCTVDIRNAGRSPAGGPSEWNPRYYAERIMDIGPSRANLEDIDLNTSLPFKDIMERSFSTYNPGVAMPDFSRFPSR